MPLTRPTPALPLVLAVLCHLPSLLSSLPPPPPPSPPPPRSPVHLHRCQEHHPKLHPPFSQSFPWLWTPGTGGGSGAWAGSPQGHHAFFALDPPVPRDPVRGGSGGVGGAVAEGEVLWPMGAKPGPGVGVPGSGATYCPRVSTARRQERLVTVVRVETNDPLRARLGTSGTAAATWTATLGFSDGRELHTMPLSAAAPTLVPPYGRPSYIDLLCMGSRDACTASTVRVTTARLGRAPDAERGDAGVHPPSSLPCASLESYVLPAQAVASDESLPTVMRWLSREGGDVLSHGSAASAKAAHAGPSQGNHGSGADIAGNLDGMGSTDNAGRVGGAGGAGSAGSAGGDVDDGDGSDGSADDNDVTLCLQLSVDRLHKLLSICDQWRGPISAAVYIGPGGEEDIEWVLRAWLASPLMRRYVDIHLVTSPPRDGDDQQAASSSLGYLQQATQRRGRPAAATRPPLPSATPFVTSSIAPPSPLLPWAYPFNYLRNVAVKGSRTEWVVTLESDMAMPSHARQRMRRLIADPANQNQAILLPLFFQPGARKYNPSGLSTPAEMVTFYKQMGSSLTLQKATQMVKDAAAQRAAVSGKVPSSKAELVRLKFVPAEDVYESHSDVFSYAEWLDGGEVPQARGGNTGGTWPNTSYATSWAWEKEPYFLVRRSRMAVYDTHVFCMQDKMIQVTNTVRCHGGRNFKVADDLWIINYEGELFAETKGWPRSLWSPPARPRHSACPEHFRHAQSPLQENIKHSPWQNVRWQWFRAEAIPPLRFDKLGDNDGDGRMLHRTTRGGLGKDADMDMEFPRLFVPSASASTSAVAAAASASSSLPAPAAGDDVDAFHVDETSGQGWRKASIDAMRQQRHDYELHWARLVRRNDDLEKQCAALKQTLLFRMQLVGIVFVVSAIAAVLWSRPRGRTGVIAILSSYCGRCMPRSGRSVASRV